MTIDKGASRHTKLSSPSERNSFSHGRSPRHSRDYQPDSERREDQVPNTRFQKTKRISRVVNPYFRASSFAATNAADKEALRHPV
jgi:hypothetical protein